MIKTRSRWVAWLSSQLRRSLGRKGVLKGEQPEKRGGGLKRTLLAREDLKGCIHVLSSSQQLGAPLRQEKGVEKGERKSDEGKEAKRAGDNAPRLHETETWPR